MFWKTVAARAAERMLNTVSMRAHFCQGCRKWFWQKVACACFANNRCKILPDKASNLLHAESQLLTNQVLHPFDPTRNSGRWITVAMVTFDQ